MSIKFIMLMGAKKPRSGKKEMKVFMYWGKQGIYAFLVEILHVLIQFLLPNSSIVDQPIGYLLHMPLLLRKTNQQSESQYLFAAAVAVAP